MGLLIFCTTRDEVERVAGSLGNQVVAQCRDSTEFSDAVAAFRTGEADVLVTSAKTARIGWRAPPGTVVLFSATFPEGPDRIQAAARVAEGGATGGW